MLNFSDQPYQYFPPKRNALVAWLLGIYNRRVFLPRVKQVSGVAVSGELGALARCRNDRRLLMVVNHSTHVDAYVYLDALRQVGMTSQIMAAYDVFLRRRREAWIMQRFGVFSVDREGSDQKAMKEAMKTVADGRHALSIFPEGNVYLQNDTVMPFHEGAAFIALRSAKALAGDGPPIAIVPVAMKLTHVTDVRDQLSARLSELAKLIGVELADDAPPLEKVRTVGQAGLEKNLHQRGIDLSATGDLPEMIRHAAESVVAPLEAKMDITPRPNDTLVDRTRKIRRAIHDIRIDDDRRHDHAVAATWADQAMLALRIASYAGDYIASRPTIDRFAETIEKLTEDAFDEMPRPFGERTAFVHIGTPIECDDYLESFNKKARIAVRELTARCEQGVQAGIDRLNEVNSHPGAIIWKEE